MARRRSVKKEHALGVLRNRIDSAKQFRQKEGYDDLWDRCVDLYRGKHFPNIADEDRVIVNIAFATINVIGPSIAINHPHLSVQARKPEDLERAIIAEAVVNYWWKHYKMHPEFRRAVDDFLIMGFGWLKSGYRFVEEDEDLSDEEWDEQFATLAEQADQAALNNPEGAALLPNDDEIAAAIGGTKTVIKEDRPFIERVSPKDVFVNPEATSMQDIKWIAHRMTKDLLEVREDERYNAGARRSVSPDTRVKDEYVPRDVSDEDPDFKRVTVWEFYDVVAGTVCVFADKGDDFLVDPTDQPFEFGHPFIMLRNYDIPDYFYPMGEMEAIEGLQQELNATRTAQFNDRKQMRRAWLYDPSAFDQAGTNALKSDEDNRMIPTNGNGRPLGEVITPLPSQQLNPQLYEHTQQIQADINNVSATNEYQRGEQSEVRRTATEASMIQDAANSRAADKLAKIERVLTDCGERLVTLAQQFLTEAQVARIEGKNGVPVWFEFEPDDIQAEFDFETEAGSTQPKNETQRRNSAMQLLQALGPMMTPDGSGPINTAEVLKHVLTFGFGIKDAGKYLNDQSGGVTAMLGGAPPDPNDLTPEGQPPLGEGPPQGTEPPVGEGAQGVPPEVLAQLQGQMGLNLPGA